MQASYDFLRAARVLLDISAKDLAKMAGVSKRSLVRIESREPVRLDTSMRVQKALEQAGIQFVPETATDGPAIRIRKGV
ncbi:helix-turn-helix domain-containing protein [Mesorhizobium sp. ANAO-SY3R2]|uniref:helix-turn-helix domain-containing protein n=1 Tax=Mesorhizobium sp. ANAO-SY3R2 TaxID=3166644 RepID=UPI00366E0BED